MQEMTVMKSNQAEFYRLEDRVLFEAGAAVQAAEAAAADVNANMEVAVEAETATQNDVQSDIADLASAELPPEVIAETAAEADPEKGLVVINSSVADAGKIVNDLGENYEILYLQSGTDALDTINDYLDAHADTEYSALHIVSHGNDGYITLNGEKISNDTLNPADWKAIGEHLTDDADILLYGCDTASSDVGKALVQTIANLTGADVAASTDTTGANGDWDLEYRSGLIESATLQPSSYYRFTLDTTQSEYDYYFIVDGSTDTTDDNTGEKRYFATLQDALAKVKATGSFDNTFHISFTKDAFADTNYRVELTGTLPTNIQRIFTVDGDLGEGIKVTIDGNGHQISKNDTWHVHATWKNLVFTGGHAEGGNGGAIYHANNASYNSLTIENVDFISNFAISNASGSNGTGGAIWTCVPLTFKGENTFSGNKVSSNAENSAAHTSVSGAAIYAENTVTVKEGASVQIENSTATINTAACGDLTYSGLVVTVKGHGSLILESKSTLKITGSAVDITAPNINSTSGTAPGTLTLNGGIVNFYGVIGGFSGSVLDIRSGAELDISGNTVTLLTQGNTALLGGIIGTTKNGPGNVHVTGTDAHFHIYGNTVNVLMSENTVSYGSLTVTGGIFYLDRWNASFNMSGGSFLMQGNSLDFNANTYDLKGGLLYVENSAPKISMAGGVDASGNYTYQFTGNKMYFTNPGENNANITMLGGTIYTKELNLTHVIMESGGIYDKTAGSEIAVGNGGAIYSYGSATLDNVLISRYSAMTGAALYAEGTATITNSTIVNNSTGVYSNSNSSITNSILLNTAENMNVKFKATGSITEGDWSEYLYAVSESVTISGHTAPVTCYLVRSDSIAMVSGSAIGATPSKILWVLSPEITTEEQTKTYGDIAVSDPVFTGVQILTENGGLSGLSMSVKYTLTADAGDIGSLDVGNYTAKTAYTGLSAEGYTSKAKDGILYLTDNKNTYYYLVSTPAEKAVSVKVNPAEITSGTVTWSETLKLGTADGTSKLTSDLLTGFTSTDILDEDAASFLATITLAAASGDFIAAGAHTAKIGGTTNGNYTFTDDFLKSQTAKSPKYTIIDKLTVSVSMTSNDDNNDGIITYGETVTLKAKASGGESGYTYQWYSDNGVISDATGESYEIINAGTGNYWVVVTDSASNIADSKLDTKSVEIQKAVATVTIKDMNITYGETVTVSAGASGVNSETVSGQFVYEYYEADQTTKLASAPVHAGTYYVKAVFTSGDANYTDGSAMAELTISKAILKTDLLTVNGEQFSEYKFTKIYDGKRSFDELENLTFKIGDTDVTRAVTGILFADANVADGNQATVSFDVNEIENYTISTASLTASAEVTKRNVKLVWTRKNISAEDFYWEYNGTAQAPGMPEIQGLAENESLTVNVTLAGDKLTENQSINAGDYTATATLADSGSFKAGNYRITAGETQSYSITPYAGEVIVTVTGNSGTVTYSGSEQSVNGYTVSIDSNLYTESCFTFSGSNVAAGTDAGIHYMNLATGDFENISTNFSNVKFMVSDGFLTVNKADITATAEDYSGIYDGAAHNITVGDVTVVNDQAYRIEYSLTGAEGSYSDSLELKNVSDSATVYYRITAANHNDLTGSASVTISNAVPDVTAENVSGTADGASYSIAVNAVTADGTAASVMYGTADGTYDLSVSPVFTEAGTYFVYYQVSAANHDTVTGSASITLTAAPSVPTDPVTPPDSSDPGTAPEVPPSSPGSRENMKSEATALSAPGQSSVCISMTDHAVMGIGSGNSVMISSTEAQRHGAAGLLYSFELRQQQKAFEESAASRADDANRMILLSSIEAKILDSVSAPGIDRIKSGETAVSDHLNGREDAVLQFFSGTDQEEEMRELENPFDLSEDDVFSRLDLRLLTAKAGQFKDGIDLALEEITAV